MAADRKPRIVYWEKIKIFPVTREYHSSESLRVYKAMLDF